MSAHTTETQLRLIGKLLLEGELHCETGLHVGAGKGSLEIGSSDNPVIKDAFGRPYIPGSSLRGRLRSLLEQSSGRGCSRRAGLSIASRGQEVRIHQSDRPDDENLHPVRTQFGAHGPRGWGRAGQFPIEPGAPGGLRRATRSGEHHAANARESGRRADRSEERKRRGPHHVAGQSANAGAGSGRGALPRCAL